VVVDSVAALLRLDFQGREGMGERQELLGKQAAALKLLAERHNIPVLVTNQVGGLGAASCCRGPVGLLRRAAR
jgi:RecA/RadA recombinase